VAGLRATPTVRELIERLGELDPDAPVRVGQVLTEEENWILGVTTRHGERDVVMILYDLPPD
jgi:hypothetical protein